jgi:hypothetical protein
VIQEVKKSPQYLQVLPIRDLRYFEAFACFHLGRMDRYFFLCDQMEKGHNRMLSFELISQLQQLPFHTKIASKNIRINIEKKTMQLGPSKPVELRRNPILLDFLIILFSHPHGIRLEDLSEILHGVKYKSEYSQARMESLLFRARALLGHKETILYEKGFLRLMPGLKFHFVDRETVKRGIEERRRAILHLAQNNRSELSLADFQKNISAARRTLQQDLHHLVKTRELQAVGKNKHRKYLAADKIKFSAINETPHPP